MRKNLKRILISAGIIGLIAVVAVAYMYNQPHRNVENSSTDFKLTAQLLVDEYLQDADAANVKYLADDGESKILEVSGDIGSIDTDLEGKTIAYLNPENSNAAVSCTFSLGNEDKTAQLKAGDQVVVKGVIRSGASYDEDLQLYEDVIMEKCYLINKKI